MFSEGEGGVIFLRLHIWGRKEVSRYEHIFIAS